jgi:ubiquinone/menaquinone biosynthesis C-methylase UbiE
MFKKNISVRKLSENNIIQVGSKRHAAELIEQFYTQNAFPNYEDFETIYDVENTLKKNKLVSSLKKAVGWRKRIIEVGSGTSQLSIALAIGTNNEIVAFDTTLKSLQIGAAFGERHGIDNCIFVNGDLINDPFLANHFDLVWCSGVLHHTENAEKGFKTIAKWVCPDGYVIIGLYNFYGRMRTVFRQLLYRSLGKSKFGKSLLSILDPVLRKRVSESRKKAWFRDQYENPVESLHTLDEVLQWFDASGIEFISSIPACDTSPIDYENIFSKKSRGNKATRLLSQILMLFLRSGSEGGLFLVIGKKLN